VGGKIVTTGMWNKLGVNWYEVGRGEMSGILSTAEPFSDAERKKIRHYMEEVYGVFKGHVTAARGDRLKKPIDKIAGGRVFTGAQALELGLVDKLGGLDDAIKFAASEARLGEYDIRVIPEPPSLFDLFMPTHDEEEVGIRATTLRLADRPEIQAMLAAVAATDPMRFRAMVRTLQRVELLHTENVLLMMPLELVVR
jgi:protease-4